MNAIRGRVSQAGRLGLPAEVRKAVGLDNGGDVVIEVDDGEIRIRTMSQVVARAQALSKAMLTTGDDIDVDAFVAERHAEAAREE